MCFITLFIGGSVTAGLAIYDTMQVGIYWECAHQNAPRLNISLEW